MFLEIRQIHSQIINFLNKNKQRMKTFGVINVMGDNFPPLPLIPV